MAIHGLGVDIVHLPRILSVFHRRGPLRLATRILSPEELVQWGGLSDDAHRARFIAVRWCVKEAAYKALYPIVRPTWKELIYRGLGEGREGTKPRLVYQPVSLASSHRVGAMHVSVSHDGDGRRIYPEFSTISLVTGAIKY